MAAEQVVDIKIGDKTYSDWSPSHLTFGECDAIERVFGGTMDEFGAQLSRGSVGALRVLVWSILRRDNAGLKTTDLDAMEIGEVEMTIREVPDPSEAVSEKPSDTADSDS